MRVELREIKRVYYGKCVVDIGALTLESGKIYAVLGPNGSGKTTMLRIIAGQDKGYTGTVLYNEKHEMSSNCIAYMPQSSYLFDLSVLQNVMLGMGNNAGEGRKLVMKERKDRGSIKKAEDALIHVGMGGFLHSKAQSLSGGEAQRVALARTLVLDRKLVLLDEPASATDLSGVELVENYIRMVNKKDEATIVFTTHNPSQAAHLADEVIMMYNGKVLEKGNPSSVFESPRCRETVDFLRNWRI